MNTLTEGEWLGERFYSIFHGLVVVLGHDRGAENNRSKVSFCKLGTKVENRVI